MNNREQPLAGGRMTSDIVRRGDQLCRPLGPWSPAVHEYLRHLESAGFTGAPRVLGVEPGREILTYLDGDVAVDPQWQPGHGHRLPPYARTARADRCGAVAATAAHRGGRVRATITDYRFHPHPRRAGQIVSHSDLGPWNTVYRQGIPVAFIDWDAAQPVDPIDDLAAAAWTFVPLVPPDQLREPGFDPVPDLPTRLRLFVDAYGLAESADDPAGPATRQAHRRGTRQVLAHRPRRRGHLSGIPRRATAMAPGHLRRPRVRLVVPLRPARGTPSQHPLKTAGIARPSATHWHR